MPTIRHIAITAEDPFETAELFKQAMGLEEVSRGDSDLAREVYLTDGYINLAIVCWKRTKANPNPPGQFRAPFSLTDPSSAPYTDPPTAEKGRYVGYGSVYGCRTE